jgi:hypothetical protein
MDLHDPDSEPYWIDEKDWIVLLEFLPTEYPENRAEVTEMIGYLFGYAQLTNTRMLALVGDPDADAYEFLFSFSSPEMKGQFLKLMDSNVLTRHEPGEIGIPAESEIRKAQALGAVLPPDVASRIALVGAAILAGSTGAERWN